jgi:TolB-like protein
MNTKNFRQNLIFISVVVFLIFSTAAGTAETTRIAIFPFSIHAGEDLDFMQAGIFEMLANRLESTDGTVTVIPREAIAAQTAASPYRSPEDKSGITKSLQAHYFVSGSLSAFGQHISTDVQFYSIQQQPPLVRLSRTGAQHGDVIAHIDQFASRVNQKVFNREIKGTAPTEDLQIGGNRMSKIGGLAVVETDRPETGRWQSSTFQTHFKGVSVGDIEGDGANEIVMIDKNRIHVYRYKNNRFDQVTRVDKGKHTSFLGVDVADINANGKAEVFISGYSKLGERPASFVFEYTNTDLSLLIKDAGWYYRVLKDTDGIPVLLAQKKVAGLTYSDRLQVLAFENGDYVSVDAITPPRAFSTFDMAFARNPQTGDRVVVGYDRNNEMTAWHDGGKIFWESGEPFGGSHNYIEYTDRQSVDIVRQYLSKRIILADSDNNGKLEAIAIRNINSSPEWMPNARRFKKGYITCLEWNAKGVLQTKWKTNEERGYISDVALADATNDGKLDLVFTVVSDVKRKMEKSSSYLVIQQLP